MNIINITHPKDFKRLRRLALYAQGLLKTQPFGVGLSGARKAICHLGYVQIDTISVVERAHHHCLYNRVPKFQPEMTQQLLQNKNIFEYWSHAAAFLPIDDYRFSLPYKNAIKSGQTHWYKNKDKKLMSELLDRIRLEGALRSRDLESDSKKQTGWWDWKPAKKALEQLYMEGEVMVSSRQGFQKSYDLTERVLPSSINSTMPSISEFAEHLLEQQLRCHGFVSLKGITYLRKNALLRKAVKELLNERLSQGELEQAKIDGEMFNMRAGAFECTTPRQSNRLMILSPFDNSVIQRDRLRTVFDFNYQIECYVPEAKRQYGYFSLPLLFRDEFIGRMDCKAHRKIKQLEIKYLHFEIHNFDEGLLVDAFAKAIKSFCIFQKCDSVKLTQVFPKKLMQQLQSALKNR